MRATRKERTERRQHDPAAAGKTKAGPDRARSGHRRDGKHQEPLLYRFTGCGASMNDVGRSNIERFTECIAGYVAHPNNYNLGTILRIAREHNGYYQLPEEQAKEIAERKYEEGRRDASTWPKPIDLAALAEREPVAPQFIVSDWLP